MTAYEKFSDTTNYGVSELYEKKIIVRDLYTGHIVHNIPISSSVSVIVVKSDGAVAWTINVVEKPLQKGPETYQVHAVDKTGNRILASSTTIDPHSLALVGNTIYWTQNGKPESAILN